MTTVKRTVGRVDDVALAVWKKPLARRIASIVLLTAMADFVTTRSDSAVITYAQHMLSAVYPVLEPAVRALAF